MESNDDHQDHHHQDDDEVIRAVRNHVSFSWDGSRFEGVQIITTRQVITFGITSFQGSLEDFGVDIVSPAGFSESRMVGCIVQAISVVPITRGHSVKLNLELTLCEHSHMPANVVQVVAYNSRRFWWPHDVYVCWSEFEHKYTI